MNELIEQIKQWGVDKGIVGPNGKGTLFGQLSKTQEELTETRDAAHQWQYGETNKDFDESFHGQHNLKDGIGDCAVTLILAAELAGLDFEECLRYAYGEIKGRTGRMENGTFVKNSK
jgi:NTP pyrophosphatase (non-canonical NTP hydrolase)